MKGKIAWIKIGDFAQGEVIKSDPRDHEIFYVEPASWELACYEKVVIFPIEDD